MAAPARAMKAREKSDDSVGGSGGSQAAIAAQASPLEAAMALYRSGKYDDAVRSFDALSNAGDSSAALWAARSVREGNGGCAAAIPRFDQVASRTFGTSVGYDAMLEGGRCLHSVGSTEAARAHFARLLTVPVYASRAQSEIDALTQSQQQVATRKMPVATKPAAAAARPPSVQTPQQQSPKAVDTKAAY
jgi:TolA-binding protein